MPRTKSRFIFTIKAESYEGDATLGKRKRLDGVSYNVFDATLGNYDDICLRFRPAWNRSEATLIVYYNGYVWECVRYVEACATKPREVGEKSAPEGDAVFGEFHMPPSEEDNDTSLGPNSFWANLTTAPTDTTIESFRRVRFEHKDDDDRAVLDLFAIVHVEPRPYLKQPASEQHFSMRLQLLMLGQLAP